MQGRRMLKVPEQKGKVDFQSKCQLLPNRIILCAPHHCHAVEPVHVQKKKKMVHAIQGVLFNFWKWYSFTTEQINF